MEKLFNALSEQGKYTKSFEDFQTQFGSTEGQEKLYGALKESGDYTKSFDNFSNQFFIAEPVKTNDSASADPAVESVNVDMGSNLENGSSELPNEKNTWLENFFGEEEDAEDKLFGAVDFVSDLWRSGKGGWAVGASVDESFDLFKSEGGMSEEDAAALVEAGRNVESYGSTNEQIAASNKMKKLQEEGYSGVGAFITAYWENPSALASTMASSLAMMASSFFDSEEVRYSAAAGSGAGAAAGAAGGAGVGAVFAGVGAVPGAIIGAKLGAVSGAMSGITAAMETGLTTAQLLEEQAISTGLDWGAMTDKQRINFVMSLTKNKDQFDDLKNKALARGLTIGGVDFVVNMATFGVGKLVSGRIAGSAASALTKPITGLATGTTESIGSGVGEYLGQKAAGQEFNFEEIALEALADKQATVISAVKNIKKGNPSYKLNGEKMNGKRFSEQLKIMDDVAIVDARIEVENSPGVQKLVDNRRGNIAADQRVDSRISDVADRAEAIRLTKEKNKLEGNKEGNKTKLAQINGELEVISNKYADSEVDATIQERQEAVAQAADTKFETEFNKNYKALKDKQKETGVEPVIFEDDNLFAETAAKDLNVTKEYILKEAPEGVFVGGGKVYINKAQAKRSINIATGNIGAISVASHEVLHPIFNALIGGAKAQGQFVNQFKKQMTSKQRAYVNKRLKSAYKDQPGAEAIELMNIFSDGIIKNEINYDQTTFEKLGSTIVDFFRSQLGLTTNEISFDDGRSVFNFLKEYNTSIKAGKLSDKAISAIKAAETKNKTTVAKAGILQEEQFSKTIADDRKAALSESIAEIKKLAAENAALAAKFGKEPIKGAKQTRLENEVLTGLEPLVAKIVTNRTKALYDPIAVDAKKGVSREQFQESLKSDIETMVLSEYDASKQDLEKFTVSRSYLRANNLAKRLGIESVEEGGIKQDIDTAKGITDEKTETTKPKEPSVERGQATFDELDIVDDTLIKDIKSDLEKEIRSRVQKGTLSETVAVKKGRETYLVTWLEDYVNKQLFKKLSKRLGAIGEKNGQTFIPGAYIDFLNDPKTFDIITKALPIKSIKKSYNKLFPTERVGRELTAEGNPIFRIKKIDKKAFLTYFVEGKKSTILERQKQLFREILEPLAKQVVADYATPENIAALKPIQALAPAESIDVVENIVIDAQLNNLESKLDRYKGEQAGFDIIQFSKEATGKFDRKEITSVKVRKALNLNEHSEEFLSLPESLQMATNWVRESLQLKGATIGGLIYEILTIGRVDANAKDLNLNIKVKTLKGEVDFDSNRPDIQLSIKKDGQTKDINYELKQSAIARCGQTTLRADFNNDEVFSVSSKRKNIAGDKVKMNFADMPTGRQLKLSLKSVQKDLRQILDIINKIDGSNINTIPMGGTMSIEAVNAVKKSEAYKRIAKVETGADGQTVSNHYNAKDTHLFQIGGIGTLLMGPDIYGLNNNDLTPVQNLTDVKFKGNLRIKFNYRYKNKKRIGASISLISEPIIANPKNLSKSPINLDTKQGTAALYNRFQFSKNLNKEFNNIIEETTGIESAKDISTAKSKILAKKKGRFKFFIPPSADDFAGLLYKLTGKGTKGEQQQAWFKQALFDPFAKGMREFESYKQNVTGIVNQLKKDIKNVPAKLKKVNKTGFTNENAVRVYLWDKNGFKIDGLNKEDIQELISIVENDKNLLDFADQMDAVLNGYPEPQNDWLAGTITTDAINMINTSKRAEFLQEWQTNADAIFSKESLNKLRAAFGENYVEALQDMLYRMKTGRNRPSGANKLTNQFMNWVNDSVGTIMFFNTRSALLQTLSTVNFINWGDNNPIAAAKAFSNQKQFWSDFAMLFNSDFLKQRRSGLKNDVNADDIANAAETATNKTKAVLSSLLKVGFLPTQIADSFAIALGGASFVRNRINKYVSEGLTKQAAEEQAFLDFQEIAEETQQSSRPDRISQQQASPLGRIILAFANTPMQYMRLTKKAFLDLKNGRGDAKTNITKIAYYMAVQNIIFSSLQAALFASLFEDDDEELNNKQIRVANSMLDSILRGVGIYGAIGSTLKNIIIEIKRQSEKDRPDYTVAAQRALSISPPIDSKMRKLMGAARTFSYKTTREKMVGYGLDNPAYYAAGQVVSATTNIPLDRAIRKADNIRVAMDNDTKYWQSVALMLGYSQWDVGLVETSKNKKNKTGFGKTTSWKKSEWKK